MKPDQEILSNIKGGIGWITLNRPMALNALSLNMIRRLAQVLRTWEENSSLKAIVIEGAGDKAFCAGGDIRAVYEAQKRRDLKTCDAFFREEYTLNSRIYFYSKPYVSLINGLAMGGGLGVSVNGSHLIVTEKALLVMPETGIGFFPDVGATTFLTRRGPVLGLYLGLTGTLLKEKDALWCGLATHYVPSSSLPLLKRDLERGMEVEGVLLRYGQVPEEKGFLETHSEEIENHFNKASLKEIFESLANESSAFAQNSLKLLRAKSPTSLSVTFQQLKREDPPLSFIENLKQEFRLSQHMVKSHDFMEGIRAALIDKDRLPRWKPLRIEEVTPQDIKPFFENLGEKELVLDEE